MAGTYFVNDNATSVAMDVFKGILEESGITGFDDDLAKYSKQSTVDEYLAEFVTDTPDAGAAGAFQQAVSRLASRLLVRVTALTRRLALLVDGFYDRVRTEAHAVGDVDPAEEDEEEFDDEDEEGEFEDGAPAAYPPASEDDGEDDFDDVGAPAGDEQGDDGDEEDEEEAEAPQHKRKKL